MGVKGTEFVVEFLSKATNVGTLKGTVNLSSLTTGDSIDLEAGTMSSVHASGEVLPITEFSGELMRDFEFAGESMSEKDSDWQICFHSVRSIPIPIKGRVLSIREW